MGVDSDYVCQDYGTEKIWTQVSVRVNLADLELASAILSMVSNQLQIEDYSDIDLSSCYGDLIDEKILNADKTHASVSVYLPGEESGHDAVAFIRSHMKESGMEGEISVNGVKEDDWANAWKQYYKPVKPGEKIVIVPAWETYTCAPGEIPVTMDPGMAFGTGTHETTRLMIRLLEKYTKPGCRMLDVGTGSGILAICASKLGAKTCSAYDIDPMSVRVARENIAQSGLDNITCDESDLLRDVDLSGGPYDLVCANIVADIIIRMSADVGNYLAGDGVLLLSGIIDSRCEDVEGALAEKGLYVFDRVYENDWVALAVKKRQ
ncbi:MAG: 50S ribosomal protein L11 methyltransferase [Clostridia bacterium]|nr:50S ribosomal protein L11 methyltransferase [Clostridia bacterium]